MAINVKRTPKITSPSLASPTIYKPPIYKPRTPGKIYRRNYNKQNTERYAKDLGDIILGNPITGTRQLQNTLIKNNAEELLYIPIINRLAGAAFMIEDRLIEPIQRDNILEAGVNTLETFGSSLDLFANPIKSLMPWAGGGTTNDFLRSMGWLDGEYREYYQWDVNTGLEPLDFVINFAGEVMSDPLNWLGLVQTGITKSGTNTLLDYGENVIKDFIPKEISESLLKEDPHLYRRVLNIYKDITEDQQVDKLVESLTNAIKRNYRIETEGLLESSKEFYAIKKRYTNAINKITSKALKRRLSDIKYAEPYRYYKSSLKVAKHLKSTKESLDKFLTLGTAVVNPITLVPPIAVKYLSDKVFAPLWNNNVLALESISKEELFNNPTLYLRQTNEKAYTRNMAMFKEIYDNYAPILNKYGLTIEDLQHMATEIYDNLDNINKIEEIFKTEFINQLSFKVPELMNTNLDDLFNAVKYAAIIASENRVFINNEIKVMLEKQLNNFFNEANKKLETYSLSKLIDYLDSELLQYNGKAYSLLELPNYLTLLYNVAPDKYTELQSLLSYLNINESNVNLVSNYLSDFRNGEDVESKLIKVLKRNITKDNNVKLLDSRFKIDSELNKKFIQVHNKVITYLRKNGHTELTDDVYEKIIASEVPIYIFENSKRGSFEILVESVYKGLNREFKENFINSNSLYRAHLDNLITLLNESNDPKLKSYAISLYNIINKLDALNIAYINTTVDYGLGSKLNNVLNNYVFDILNSFKKYKPSNILSGNRIDEFVETTLTRFLDRHPLTLDQQKYVANMLKDTYTNQAEQMMRINNKHFLDYLSTSDRDILNNIGGKYPQVLQYLIDNKVDPNQIKVCEDVVYSLITPNMSIIHDSLNDLQNSVETTNYIRRVLYLLENKKFKTDLNQIMDEVEYKLGTFNKKLQLTSDSLTTQVLERYGTEVKIKEIARYLTIDELNNLIKSMNVNNNIYSFINETGVIAPKLVFDPKFLEQHKLSKKFIGYKDAKTNYIFYQLFNNSLRDTSNIFINKYDLQKIRDILTETFKDKTFSFHPLDADYFNNLDADDLKAWHHVMHTQNIDDNLAKLYSKNYRNYKMADKSLDNIKTNISLEESLKAHMDPTYFKVDIFNEKEDITPSVSYAFSSSYDEYDPIYAEDYEVIQHDARNVQNLTTAKYNSAITQATQLYKSRDSLTTYKEEYIDFINNDVQAYKNCKPLIEMDAVYSTKISTKEQDDLIKHSKEEIAKEMISDKPYNKEYDDLVAGLNPEDSNLTSTSIYKENEAKLKEKKKAYKNIRHAINYNRARNLQQTLINLNPLQLRSWMDDNLTQFPVKMLFLEADLDGGLEDLTKRFTKEQLEEAGLTVKYYKNFHEGLSFNIIIASNKKVERPFYSYKNDTQIPKHLISRDFYDQQDIIYESIDEAINKGFEENKFILKLDKTTIPVELYNGSTITGQLYSGILKNKKFVQDTDIQNILEYFNNNSELFDPSNSFTNGSLSLPNTCFIGSESFINNLIDSSKDILGDYLPYESTDSIIKAWRSQVENIKRINNVTKYTSLFFNDDFYIDNSIFRNALKDATDKELQEFFNKHNYQVAILKKDKLGSPKVYKIFIKNKADYLNAIKAKAIVVPHEVYRNMVITINKKYTNSVWVKLYKSIISATYKFIYLTNPGFLMRSYLDSGIYKNLNTLGGFPDIIDNFKYQHKATQALKLYNEMYVDIMKQYQRPPTIYDFKEYFTNNKIKYTDEQIDLFLLIDVFSKSSAAGGQAKAIEEFLLEFNMSHTANNVDKWIQAYTQNVLNNPLFSYNNELNNQIENISRISLFMRLLDNGNSYTEAIAKVVDTHFDYVLKEDPMDLLNEVFWFSTFPINNFMYYMNNSLGNSDMLRMQSDLIELSYNNEDTNWDDVRKSSYLTYNVLAGNILFKINEDNTLILKTGSSVLDFFSLLLDPFGEVKDRLNPFLRVLTGNAELSALNPLYTTSNRLQSVSEFFKTKGEQGSLLPSIYNKLYNNKYNKNYKSYRRKSSWNYKTKYPSKYKTPKVSSVNAYINNLKPYKYVKRSDYATLVTNNRLKYNKHKIYSRYDVSKRKFRKPNYYYKRRESISQPR